MTYAAVGFISFTSGGFSYPDIKSGGNYISWWGEDWDDDEVYVFRLRVKGLPSTITSSSQVYPVLRAYVESVPSGLRNQDVRGICVKPTSGGQLVEIVFTDAGGFHTGKMHADDMAEAMAEKLSSAGSPLTVDQPAFAYLNNDLKEKIRHWFAQTPLWSYSSYNASGKQNITQGFTRAYLDQQGIWLNSSAISPQYQLRPPPPPVIDVPPPQPAEKKTPSQAVPTEPSVPATVEPVSTASTSEIGTGTMVAIGVLGAAALYFLTSSRRD